MALVSIAIVNTHYMRIVSKALYIKAAAKAAALGLLQPLEALSLDADTLRTATAAAVAYCDAQGADNVSDLVERASKLIAHPQAALPSANRFFGLAPMAWRLLPC